MNEINEIARDAQIKNNHIFIPLNSHAIVGFPIKSVKRIFKLDVLN